MCAVGKVPTSSTNRRFCPPPPLLSLLFNLDINVHSGPYSLSYACPTNQGHPPVRPLPPSPPAFLCPCGVHPARGKAPLTSSCQLGQRDRCGGLLQALKSGGGLLFPSAFFSVPWSPDGRPRRIATEYGAKDGRGACGEGRDAAWAWL